jgi:hypothetical protein
MTGGLAGEGILRDFVAWIAFLFGGVVAARLKSCPFKAWWNSGFEEQPQALRLRSPRRLRFAQDDRFWGGGEELRDFVARVDFHLGWGAWRPG